ncbi:MAG: FHA domain-containing protein [Acidobacteriota bacterium]|nr:FHA domain-containing protein [Acidobacteriota bacterium]
MRLRLIGFRPLNRLYTTLALAAALLALAASPPVASAQGDAMAELGQEYAQLEAQGLKENFQRQLSYTMLLEYLPPGTRMTSGYRSPEKQLDLIMRMARSKGIPTPDHASVADESSWRPALNALRAKGFIVASPTNTPHSTDEDVFDLAGADLNAIQDGLRKAEKAGLVKYRRIIFETQNNAVHVEIESLSPKVLNSLGARLAAKGSSSPSSSPSSVGVGSSQPTAANEQGVMQQLQSLHDAEPDPAKKIDYDRSMINLLDPASDASRISALNDEIKQHQRDAESLATDTRKRQAIADVTDALKDERYEDAERAAIFLARNYPEVPEARGMLVQIRTRRLVNEASDAIYSSDKPDYAQCQRADKLLTAALKLSPDYEGAQFIRADIDSCLRRGRNIRIALVGGAIFLFVGVGVGLFFLARSQGWLAGAAGAGGAINGGTGNTARGWAVEVVEGAGRGLTFALAKAETIIGSKGPPGGAADIVILDAERKISRRHCTVAQQSGRFYLLDESTNGTKINGQPAPRGSYVEFRAGDQINLADVSVVVVRPN